VQGVNRDNGLTASAVVRLNMNYIGGKRARVSRRSAAPHPGVWSDGFKSVLNCVYGIGVFTARNVSIERG
jgi:hypothetical protein